MAVNLLVAIVTLLMIAFVVVWLLAPRLRVWMEAPKHRFLDNQRRFPDIVRDDTPSSPS
jgi:uncharacterized iron-regulated membrane protein